VLKKQKFKPVFQQKRTITEQSAPKKHVAKQIHAVFQMMI